MTFISETDFDLTIPLANVIDCVIIYLFIFSRDNSNFLGRLSAHPVVLQLQ